MMRAVMDDSGTAKQHVNHLTIFGSPCNHSVSIREAFSSRKAERRIKDAVEKHHQSNNCSPPGILHHDIDILMTHVPELYPSSLLKVRDSRVGRKFGSHNMIEDIVKEMRPKLHCSGHIHRERGWKWNHINLAEKMEDNSNSQKAEEDSGTGDKSPERDENGSAISKVEEKDTSMPLAHENRYEYLAVNAGNESELKPKVMVIDFPIEHLI